VPHLVEEAIDWLSGGKLRKSVPTGILATFGTTGRSPSRRFPGCSGWLRRRHRANSPPWRRTARPGWSSSAERRTGRPRG